MDNKKEVAKLLKAVDSNEIIINPQWIYSVEEEHLQAQHYNWLHTYRVDIEFRKAWPFIADGLLLIEVDVQSLLNNLCKTWKKPMLKHEYLKDYSQTLKILSEWRDEISLTAPSCLILFDEGCIRVEDGKHRMNTAIRLGAEQIPVIIPKAQLKDFQRLLGLVKIY